MQKKSITVITASLLLALGLVACDKPGPAEEAGKKIDKVTNEAEKKVSETVDKLEDKMAEQSTKNAQTWDDTEITARVKTDLLAEPGLKSMEISVDTIKGVVTLTGKVDSKVNAEKVVARTIGISGVKGVNNQLTVETVQ